MKKTHNYYAIALILAVLATLIVKIDVLLPFGIDKGIIGAVWLYLGYIYFKFLKDTASKYSSLIIPCLIIILSFLPIPQLNIALKYFSNLPYNYFYSLLVIVLVILVMQKIGNLSQTIPSFIHKSAVFLGRNSMLIFLIHPYTNNIAYLIVEKFWGDIFYLKFAISMSMLVVLAIFKNKYLNKGFLKYV